MRKRKPTPGTSALEERGRARLMLRLPHCRQALAEATAERFLDFCEAYELAWLALGYWSQSGAVEAAERLREYQDIAASLETEVADALSTRHQPQSQEASRSRP